MQKFFKAFWRVVTFPFRALWWLLTLPFRGVKKALAFLRSEPEEAPMSDVFVATVQQPGALLEHVNDLRMHLLRILIVLGVCAIAMFAFTQDVIEWLAVPVGGLEKLQAIDVTETIGVFMRVSLFGALAAAFPYIAFELWLFAAPGLRSRAKVFGLLGIPLVGLFFAGGIAFVYFKMLPVAMPFLLDFMNVETVPRISSYINFVTGLMFWIGLAFEFPLVVYVLSLMGLVKPGALLKYWRVAVVVIAIVAAAITPTVDPINMGLVMAPMILLYFLSIGLSYLGSAGRKKNPE